jgi:hypothetical protein
MSPSPTQTLSVGFTLSEERFAVSDIASRTKRVRANRATILAFISHPGIVFALFLSNKRPHSESIYTKSNENAMPK